MKLKMLIVLLAMLLLVSSVSAKTLDEHINKLLDGSSVGKELPKGISTLLSKGTIQAYIIPEVPSLDYLDLENKTFTYAISVNVESKKVVTLEEGELAEPDLVILASETAALNVFESDNPASTLAAEVESKQIIYVINDAGLRAKFNFIKTIAKFLAIFSPGIRELLPIFG